MIVSVTVTLPLPTVFHLMVTELADVETMVPRVDDHTYVWPDMEGVVYISSSFWQTLFAPEITGSGRGFTTMSVVAVTGDPHPKVAVRRYL